MNKKEVKCPHCDETLMCETCGGNMWPAIFGEKVLGYLCPKCMEDFARGPVTEPGGGRDVYPHMEN